MKNIIYIAILLLSVSCKSQNENVNKEGNNSRSKEALKSEEVSIKQSEYETFIRNFPNQQMMTIDILFYEENKVYFNNASKYLSESLVLLQKNDISPTCKDFIICLMHGLDFDNYMLFSNKVLDFYENDKITIDLLSDLYEFEAHFKPNFYDNRNDEKLKEFTSRYYNSTKIPEYNKEHLKKYLSKK